MKRKRKFRFYPVFEKQIDEAAAEVLELARQPVEGDSPPIDVSIHLWAVQSMQRLLLDATERPLEDRMDLYVIRKLFEGKSRYLLQMIRELRTRFGVIDSPYEEKSRNTVSGGRRKRES